MLTWEINKYSEPKKIREQKADKPKFLAGSDDHKQHIFSGTLANALNVKNLEEGSPVYIKRRRGDSGEGIIINVITDFNMVEWDGLRCKFIEVFVYSTQDCILCHPSELSWR